MPFTCRVRWALLAVVAAAAVAAAVAGMSGCAPFERGPYVMSKQEGQVQVLYRPGPGLPAGVRLEVLDGGGAVLGSASSTVSPEGTHVCTVRLSEPAKAAAYRFVAGGKPATKAFPLTLPRAQGPTRVILYGDTRTNSDDHRLVAQAIARVRGVQAVFHVGDFVTDGTVARLWDPEFFTPARSMLSRCPIFPVLGNHEKRSPLYFDAFNIPPAGGYYSRRIGQAQFIVLDVYQKWDELSPQCQWLQKELSAAPPGVYKVMVFHEPLFSAQGNRAHSIKMIRGLGPLFEAAGVDLVVCGHDHHYTRSAVIGGQEGKGGATYIVTGGGGAPRRIPTPAAWAKCVKETLEYLVMDIDAGGRMTLSARDTAGREFDRYVLAAPGSQVAELAFGPLVAEQMVQTDLEKAFQDHFLIDRELKGGEPIAQKFVIPLKNAARDPIELALAVRPGNWSVKLSQDRLTIEPGASAELTIDVAHDAQRELYPTPVLTCGWKLGKQEFEPLETALFLSVAPTGPLPRVGGPLKLDGMTTEKFWSEIPKLGYLLREDGKGLATGRTDMLVAAGPDALYVAVVCDEDMMDKVRAQAKRYDDPKLWSDDCVELFIEPVKDSKLYYQMVVSITGFRFDGKGEDPAWNGQWEATVARAQTSWTIEAKIPWATLGLPGQPPPGSRLGFNVGRTRNAVKELSQWSRIPSGKSHTPEKFGTLVVK